jgi:hypothetical protein
MARTSPWWRRVGMALAALVLTVLTFGPGVDGLLCRDEGSISAVAAELPAASAATGDDGHGALFDEGPGICVHGHCHHSAPHVPAIPTAHALSAPLTAVAHPLVRDRVPTTDPKFGLIRPPRA